MLLIGFDPGGTEQFGWCVAEADEVLPIKIKRCGACGNASEAVAAVLDVLGTGGRAVAVGIDSPLFWVPGGDRRADGSVRRAIAQAGAPHASGTVQHVSSLKGACLVQGVLSAHLLRREQPNVAVTESHPKALLWLLSMASSSRPVRSIVAGDLAEMITTECPIPTEHERDAALGALTAWAMVTKAAGWRDLFMEEQDAFVPVSPVSYWMPIVPPREAIRQKAAERLG